MDTGPGAAPELEVAQRGQARRLVAWMQGRGVGGLDGSTASLGRLDDALERLHPKGLPPDEIERLAPLVAAYTGEVLINALGGGWVLDPDAGAPLVEDPDRYRIRVQARATRLLGEGAGSTHGMASLLDRTRTLLASRAGSTAAAAPSTPPPAAEGFAPSAPAAPARHGRMRSPLGEDRPLGLRRAAFHDEDTSDPDPILDVIPFRPVAQDASGTAARDSGFGPSVFVWVMILIVFAVIAYAAYLYRNAPP